MNNTLHFMPTIGLLTFVFLVLVLFTQLSAANDKNASIAIENTLGLEQAISISIENDLTLSRSGLHVKSYLADIESISSRPDPVFFAAMQNLPTDTFDLDQEPMTQMRIGVKQMLSKGDSVELSKNIIRHSIAIEENQRIANAMQLKLSVESAWLEAWYWQRHKALIEHDRVFLTQMFEFIQSMYQIGSKNQSDLLGAELELIKLDEKLLDAERQYLQYRQALHHLANQTLPHLILAPTLPELLFKGVPAKDQLVELLQSHPEIKSLDKRIEQAAEKVRLSEQDEKARWGVELSYGLRQGDNMDGTSRSDLFTAGVNVQLPIFSQSNKQQASSSLRYKQESLKNKRLERLQKIYFELESMRLQYENTVSQRKLYETKILPTLTKQKDSALQSYQTDKGDFRVVIDLYLKEQMTKLKQLRLAVTEQLFISKINYWLDVSSVHSYLNNINFANQESRK